MNRILFVIESLFALGPAQQLFELIRSLDPQAFEIHIAEFSHSAIPSRFEKIPVTIHRLNRGLENLTSGKSARIDASNWRLFGSSVYHLQNLIQKIQPNRVHGWCGQAVIVAQATAQFSRGTRAGAPIFLGTELFIQPKKRFLRQCFESYCRSKIAIMVVPHEVVKQNFIKQGFAGRIEIVANQICSTAVPTIATVAQWNQERQSSRAALRAALQIPENSIIAGAVAPLIARSRLKDLIWATDLLNCIRDDFHLVIFGQGHQRERLIRFAAQTEAAARVHFLGEPPQATRWLTGLDCFWQSHLNEPLPGNLLNAMQAGIPVISVYGGGTTEIIRHQETGLAVNFGARDEFARWTKYLIEQPASARRLADQGREFVTHHFASSATAERYVQLWNSAAVVKN